MTAWVIRGGKYAEREDEALENGFLTIGFGIIKSLDNVETPDGVAGCLDLSGNETNQQLASRVSQVWAFKDGIKTGDTVVMPRKGPSLLAVGRITGEYTYRPEPSEFSHARAVEWINQEVPKSRLPQDLQGPMNGLKTIYRPSPGGAPKSNCSQRPTATREKSQSRLRLGSGRQSTRQKQRRWT
jgi:restriction system protein